MEILPKLDVNIAPNKKSSYSHTCFKISEIRSLKKNLQNVKDVKTS